MGINRAGMRPRRVSGFRAGWAITLCLAAFTPVWPAPEPDAGETGPGKRRLSPREIVESASPSVVLIQAESLERSLQGSGFVIDELGTLATALHVVEGASKITVTFPHGDRVEARAVLAYDVQRDLAILQLDPPVKEAPFSALNLKKEALVKAGDPVLVISNPLGLESTVSEGIVGAWRNPSSTDRVMTPELEKPPVLPPPPCRLLQISAAVSPGSSGGPVFDESGDVIGVATSGVLYGMASLNFAVPVEELHVLLGRAEALDLITFREMVARNRLDLARPEYESALLAFDQENDREARNLLGRALLYYPGFDDALVLSGRIAIRTGEMGRASELLERAVEANGEHVQAWYYLGLVHEILAVDSESTTSLLRAQEAYERVLDLDPLHAQASFSLAVILLNQGLMSRVEELLLTATEQEPGMVDAHYLLGEIYFQRREMDRAESEFKAALWENEDHALSHLGLARIYIRTKSRAPTRRHLRRFLALSEDDLALQRQREVALRMAMQYFPEMLAR